MDSALTGGESILEPAETGWFFWSSKNNIYQY